MQTQLFVRQINGQQSEITGSQFDQTDTKRLIETIRDSKSIYVGDDWTPTDGIQLLEITLSAISNNTGSQTVDSGANSTCFLIESYGSPVTGMRLDGQDTNDIIAWLKDCEAVPVERELTTAPAIVAALGDVFAHIADFPGKIRRLAVSEADLEQKIKERDEEIEALNRRITKMEDEGRWVYSEQVRIINERTEDRNHYLAVYNAKKLETDAKAHEVSQLTGRVQNLLDQIQEMAGKIVELEREKGTHETCKVALTNAEQKLLAVEGNYRLLEYSLEQAKNGQAKLQYQLDDLKLEYNGYKLAAKDLIASAVATAVELKD